MILSRPDDAGRIIRQRRLDVGLAQSQLAERAGITRQLLSRFEQGKSDLPFAVILRMMRELDLSIDVRPRQERVGVVELRLPVMDPSALADLPTQRLAGIREALTQLAEVMPRFDVRGLARLQESVVAASYRTSVPATHRSTRDSEEQDAPSE